MTRRIFLKTTGALITYFTAQNVLGGIVAKADEVNYIQNLRKAVDEGYIHNQTFILTNPIDFGDLNLKFDNCIFIFKNFTHEYAMRMNWTIQMTECEIDASCADVKAVLYLDQSCADSTFTRCNIKGCGTAAIQFNNTTHKVFVTQSVDYNTIGER